MRFSRSVVLLVSLLAALLALPGVVLAESGKDGGKAVGRDRGADPVDVGSGQRKHDATGDAGSHGHGQDKADDSPADTGVVQSEGRRSKGDNKEKPGRKNRAHGKRKAPATPPAPQPSPSDPPVAGGTTAEAPNVVTQPHAAPPTVPAQGNAGTPRRRRSGGIRPVSQKPTAGGAQVDFASAGQALSSLGAGSRSSVGRERKPTSGLGIIGTLGARIATVFVEAIPSFIFYLLAGIGLLTLVLGGTAARERRLRNLLLAQSMIDGLTGVANREGFDRAIALEWARSLRHDRPLSVAFIDLDKFKIFNDSHGHLAGDRLLRQTAAAIATAVREIDTIARLGGDEFVVICPETSADGMTVIGDRIGAIAAGLPVGLSIGYASRGPDDLSYVDLVSRADEAMYVAKRDAQLKASCE